MYYWNMYIKPKSFKKALSWNVFEKGSFQSHWIGLTNIPVRGSFEKGCHLFKIFVLIYKNINLNVYLKNLNEILVNSLGYPNHFHKHII